MCWNSIINFDQTFREATGVDVGLLASTACGITLLTATVLAINNASDVPF
ncbi:hypothetical protein [Mycobacterium lepromatosis]|nr:hypothetical protein [Mycobacterium lepromatosis]